MGTVPIFPVPILLIAACGYYLVRDGDLNRAIARRVQDGIVAFRELRLVSEVPIDVQDRGKLRRYLKKELDREFTPKELAALGRIYQLLGLLPADLDLAEALLKLYTGQIAGFYDPRAEKLFLVESEAVSGGWFIGLFQFLVQRDLVGEMLLAHELTHALQDQHFDVLGAADDPTDDDRALAARAVAEGDATLAGLGYTLGGLSGPVLLSLVERLQGIPAAVAAVLPETPPILRDALVFQYSEGSRFVSWAYFRDGWNGVNAVLAAPPASTEQILWPEKYYLHPDEPQRVSLGGLEGVRDGGGFEWVEENTFGELGLRIFAETCLERDRAVGVAAGWDGDRFAAFVRGREIELFWLTTWDSREDAAEFLEAAREILSRRFPESGPEGARDRVTGAGAVPYLVERREERVLAILGAAVEGRDALAASIWEKSSFVPESRELPLDLAQAEKAPLSDTRTLPSPASFSR